MSHPRHRELQVLVDDEDLASVLRIATLDDVAAAWCRYTRESHNEDEEDEDEDDDPDWWAVEFFMTPAIFDDTALHRAALLKLLEHTDDEHLISCIGAGPLEDFLCDDEDDLRWIETHAAANPKLRQALSGVWVALDVSAETLERLDRAAGTTLPRPRPASEWPAEVHAFDAAEAELARHFDGDPWDVDEPSPEQISAIREFIAATESLLDLSPDGPEKRDGRPA